MGVGYGKVGDVQSVCNCGGALRDWDGIRERRGGAVRRTVAAKPGQICVNDWIPRHLTTAH